MKRTFNTCMFLLLCMFSSNLSATYYIAGNGDGSKRGNWCGGNDWEPSATELENDEITYENLPAEWYEFKITQGSWDPQWKFSDLDLVNSSPGYKTYGDGGNICFRLQEPTNVTIRMVEGKVQLIIGRNLTIVGNGDAFENDVWLGGQYWGNVNNHTIINSGNGYSKTFYNLPVANGYQFKVKDYAEGWDAGNDNVWGYSRLDTEHSNIGADWGGDNIGFDLSLPSDVTVSMVENKVRLNAAPVYFIAGNGSSTERGTWCNQESWWQDEPNSRLDAATLSKTYKALPAGEYEFKLTNGRWQDGGGTVWAAENVDLETSSKGFMGAGTNNIKFHLQAPTDVTISFNPTTEKISLVSSNGYFLCNKYSLVGDETLTGFDWANDETSTELTPKGDGSYEFIMHDKVLNAGSYDYKIIGGHSWGTGCEYPTANATVVIPENGTYTIVFTLNPSEGTQSNAVYLHHDVTISAYGYSTFYSDKAFVLPDGLTATIYTNISGTMLTGETITTIPANTGVVLCGAANATYTLLQTTTDESYPANLLHGTTSDQVINNSNVHYILGVNGGQCGLFWPNDTDEGVGSFTNKAGKAYLEVEPAAMPAPVRGFIIAAPTVATGLDVVSQKEDNCYYDLFGRKVAEPQAGNVYIQNGKKVVLF